MFGIGKNKDAEKDPKKALENAEKKLNTGVSGFMTKTFMGKDFTDKMNQSIDMAKGAIGNQDLATTGLDATAEVMSIEDTGMLINNNPVVKMKLKVEPRFGVGFETTAQTAVSKIAIPRVGDKINIKYNPADNTQILVV